MNRVAIAMLASMFLLLAPASTAIEESAVYSVGDKWAFGKEIDLMEEASLVISELENNITELMSSEEAEMVKNASGLELKSFDLANKAILGFYYTGEVVDDFDQMIHMQTEQSLYSHTVLGTKFTSMFPKEGEHDLRLEVTCQEDDEECEDPEIKLLDNVTGEPLVLEELNTEIGGSMHYVVKITQDTWWTQDTHELAKTEITFALGAAGEITIRNVPNITVDGNSFFNDDDDDDDDGDGYGWNTWNYCEWEGEDWAGDTRWYCTDNEDGNDGFDDWWYYCEYDQYDGLWWCTDDYGQSPDYEYTEGNDRHGGSGDGGDEPFSVCDEGDNGAVCYETIDIKLETAVFEMAADASIHLVFDFGDDPMNVLDLPLDENKYWDGDMSRLTISGDVGGKVDIKKPELSICPDSDCDQLPEMEELYSGLTEAIQELHDNETFSITVDRNNDGLPDVITGWNDIFPIYIPETWMDQIFQEILEAISCEDDESAQEGEDCDETAEEEFKRLNLRIENNRFAFGPYSVHEIEDFSPIPYAFETGEKETATASDGTGYEGYQVFPTDQCSEKNPDRDDDDCDREDDDEGDDGPGDVIPGGSRSSHDEDRDCEGDPFCDSEIIWFHDAKTGHPAYINMDMPNLREEGYVMEMMPIDPSVAEAQVDANADADNPQKTTLIEVDAEEIEEESALPGFGIMAAIGSLMIAGRRFRK